MQPVNYPYYPQQSFQQQARPAYMDSYAFVKGRPVSSMDEARASMIDFDGSIFYFPDTANNRIYSKQFNMDGSASFKVYQLIETPVTTPPQSVSPSEMVTREEFDKTINDVLLKINALTVAPTQEVSVQPVQEQPKTEPAAQGKQAYKF